MYHYRASYINVQIQYKYVHSIAHEKKDLFILILINSSKSSSYLLMKLAGFSYLHSISLMGKKRESSGDQRKISRLSYTEAHARPIFCDYFIP